MMRTSFFHLKLDVADLRRSLDFYCGILNWRVVVRYDRQDGVTIVQISPTGMPPGIELWHEPPLESFAQDRLHFALTVDGVHRKLDRYGSRRDQMRQIFETEGDWGRLLAAFAQTAADSVRTP
jgi:catechol 2,3-dioxygenase-like lactoylglutathione lyase family enzyme